MADIVSSDDREAWIEARRSIVTASDVAAILGENEYRTREQVIMEKAGLAEEFKGNERTELGLALEPWIAERARERWGWNLIPHGNLVIDAVCRDLGATPDYTMPTPWGPCNVQVKATTVREYEHVKKYDGKPPMMYILQCQAEMAVLGYAHSSLLVFHTSSMAIRAYYVPRHDRVIARIRLEASRVMDEVRALRAGRMSA